MEVSGTYTVFVIARPISSHFFFFSRLHVHSLSYLKTEKCCHSGRKYKVSLLGSDNVSAVWTFGRTRRCKWLKSITSCSQIIPGVKKNMTRGCEDICRGWSGIIPGFHNVSRKMCQWKSPLLLPFYPRFVKLFLSFSVSATPPAACTMIARWE